MRVGTTGDYPPLTVYDAKTKEFSGIDIEAAKKLAQSSNQVTLPASTISIPRNELALIRNVSLENILYTAVKQLVENKEKELVQQKQQEELPSEQQPDAYFETSELRQRARTQEETQKQEQQHTTMKLRDELNI